MLKYNPPVDPTQAPWTSWNDGGKTMTVCKHCLQYRTSNSHQEVNHYRWCPWLSATLELLRRESSETQG